MFVPNTVLLPGGELLGKEFSQFHTVEAASERQDPESGPLSCMHHQHLQPMARFTHTQLISAPPPTGQIEIETF